MTLPAFAAVRRGAVAAERLRLLSIDLLLPVGRSAANLPHAAPAAERWDRQTDSRTDDGPFHRPFSAYYAVGVNNTAVAFPAMYGIEIDFKRRRRRRCFIASLPSRHHIICIVIVIIVVVVVSKRCRPTHEGQTSRAPRRVPALPHKLFSTICRNIRVAR